MHAHDTTTNAVLFTVFILSAGAVFGWMIRERRRHETNLAAIPVRIVVNGIRGKSSITRLVAGSLRRSHLIVVAKTTGTAARFIYPNGREVPIKRPYDVVNVVEQVAIVHKAAGLGTNVLVAECMAVEPALQELNQQVLIQAGIVVISNVREDHLEEMGPTLDDVARSLARSMPVGGICVTAEAERFDILQQEALARDCALYYADPQTVTDEEMAPFTWITFKENVAIALLVASLCNVDRRTALLGMYTAPPDPGALKLGTVQRADTVFRTVNLFAANDPQSTLMNVDLLRQRGDLTDDVYVVINCRDDRVERNQQMGDIIPAINPSHVFVIGSPTRSAVQHIHPDYLDRVVQIDGVQDGEYYLELLTRDMPEYGATVIMIGNIHGMGEVLLHAMEAEGPFVEDLAVVAEARNLADELFDREVEQLLSTGPISLGKE